MGSNAGNLTDLSRQDETVEPTTCLHRDDYLFSFVKLYVSVMTTQALLVSFGAFAAACLTLWTFRLVSAESSQN